MNDAVRGAVGRRGAAALGGECAFVYAAEASVGQTGAGGVVQELRRRLRSHCTGTSCPVSRHSASTCESTTRRATSYPTPIEKPGGGGGSVVGSVSASFACVAWEFAKSAKRLFTDLGLDKETDHLLIIFALLCFCFLCELRAFKYVVIQIPVPPPVVAC